MYIRSLPPMLPIQYGSLSARTLPLTVLIIVSMNNIQLFFFFKQKTAYEMELWTGVQTCALPISFAIGKPLSRERIERTRLRRHVGHLQDFHGEGANLAGVFDRVVAKIDLCDLHIVVRPGQRRSEERRVGKECRDRRRSHHATTTM